MKTRKRIVDYLVNVPNDDGDAVLFQVPVRIPVDVDPNTGEELITDEGNEIIESVRARHMGLMTPAEIKALRLCLGLSQREVSELLRCGEKSYTRWENGNGRPSQLVNLVLCALRDSELSLDYLRNRRRGVFDWRQLVSPKPPHWIVPPTTYPRGEELPLSTVSPPAATGEETEEAKEPLAA
jgi:DNA-binding transcriptional regulator YiaG